ncbi:OTU-domain-containing protein [Annulohypoxylon truncatum]|uniref:OTU-domain-containing protein n=1 Tax=Annulohypoxylon truncatum TaxID=327061 RepID=UPI0020085809|nr:OTU-domain-containing protein [Annulohypoxylon truncatum]KAI1207758.1 OTU-domain-containing protein [Annulohypoxylon truncatum]
MKIRYRAPSGPGALELDDDATVNQLLEALKSSTGLDDLTVKYGWPPKALSTDEGGVSLQSLGLHREMLTIAPLEKASTVAKEEPQAIIPDLDSSEGKGRGVKDQQISVFMPESNSTLGRQPDLLKYLRIFSKAIQTDVVRLPVVLRVMPDDNSCLFTAVGGALRGYGSDPDKFFDAVALRRIVVDHIRANPEKYNAVILGKSPEAYCNNMLRPDVWGGDIELSIMSEVFQLEISVVDVKTGNVYRIGQGNDYEMRCVIVYSNIHYDRVAEIFVEGQGSMEFDVARWAVDGSEHIIKHAQEMCKKLKEEYHYYTDTSDFVVTCNECGWLGQGQKALAEHAIQTGHTDISEIKDNS